MDNCWVYNREGRTLSCVDKNSGGYAVAVPEEPDARWVLRTLLDLRRQGWAYPRVLTDFLNALEPKVLGPGGLAKIAASP